MIDICDYLSLYFLPLVNPVSNQLQIYSSPSGFRLVRYPVDFPVGMVRNDLPPGETHSNYWDVYLKQFGQLITYM